MPDDPSAADDLPEVQPLDLSNLDDTLRTTLWSWVESTVALLPNIVLALLVLGLTWLIARLTSSLTRNALQRFSSNQQLTHLASVAARVAVLGAGFFAALAILGLNGVVASLLAGVGVVGLALGFAFQDIAANFMSSILLAASRPYRVGDLIRTTDFFGVVERTDLRVTRLRTLDGELVLIPNKDVYNHPMVNLTETPDLRVEVALGVGYDDDLRAARDATRGALESLHMRNAEKPVQVFFTGFGSSSIDFVARFWIRASSQADVLEARSEAIIAVKDAIDTAGLNIPFPIRTLDFGATPVGGERLDTVLRPVFASGEH